MKSAKWLGMRPLHRQNRWTKDSRLFAIQIYISPMSQIALTCRGPHVFRVGASPVLLKNSVSLIRWSISRCHYSR